MRNLKFYALLALILVWGGYIAIAQSQAPFLQYGVLPWNTANTAIGTASLSVGQMTQGILVGTPVAAATYTTPTATALCAAFPFVKTNGQRRWTYAWYVKNAQTGIGDDSITVAGGSGVTLSGSGLVPVGSVKRFEVVLDNCDTPAIHLLPVGSAGW